MCLMFILRLDLVSFSRGSYKFQSQYPGLSFHEKALEETEDMNVVKQYVNYS